MVQVTVKKVDRSEWKVCFWEVGGSRVEGRGHMEGAPGLTVFGPSRFLNCSPRPREEAQFGNRKDVGLIRLGGGWRQESSQEAA